MRIAIFSAFPQELKYVVRNARIKRSLRKESFRFFFGEYFSHEIMMVETGMGIINAESALKCAVEEFSPDLILSIGFGGAMYDNAGAGDLVWASSVLFFSEAGMEAIDIPGAQKIAAHVSGKISMHEGKVITLARWMSKRDVRALLPMVPSYAVCDMETYPSARFSTERGIPFFAVRAITDRADEEIPAALLSVSDESGRYRLPRALKLIFSNPGIIPDIIRLRRTSETAAANLYVFVKSLLEML